MHYYAVATYRTTRENYSGRIMLYRFKTKRARDAFVRNNPDGRAPISRDYARIIFPKTRFHAQDAQWWIPVEIPNPERHADGSRAAHIKAGYFYDCDEKRMATAPFELIADVKR